MSQTTIVIPRIQATACVPVILPPAYERQTLRAPLYVVDGEIVASADDYQPPAPPPQGRWRVPVLFGALAVVSLLVGATLGLVVSPLLFATATVTLRPQAHTLTTSTEIPLTVRVFRSNPESLSRTITATGTATRPATTAQGSITFYNALPAPQTVAAGTLLMTASGVPVLTEQDASIPAASPPTEGATTVSAHAENPGPAGNIASGSIGGPCCRAYVLAYNGGFWGGADARTYRTPTSSDITVALVTLRRQVSHHIQDAIHEWLRPHEVLLPPTCHASTSSSAQPGDAADHVTVTAEETCTAAAYDESALEVVATARLGAVATNEYGTAYRLVSEIRTDLTGITVTRNRAVIRVQLEGSYSYHFSAGQLSQLRAQLVGVSRDRGAEMLVHAVGVGYARIESDYATLPRDPGRIRIVVAQ